MNQTQNILSKLKACGKLAGDKAEGRRPRLASCLVAALKGRWSYAIGSSAPSGRDDLLFAFLGYRFAQPQANFRQPFRLLAGAPSLPVAGPNGFNDIGDRQDACPT